MTKLEALRKTELMWLWLAANPGAEKDNYPSAALDAPKHQCYCCQYVLEQVGEHRFNFGCSDPCSVEDDELLELCPLNTLWKHGCQGENSPYVRWCNTRRAPQERTDAAKQIADAAHNEIIKLCQTPQLT